MPAKARERKGFALVTVIWGLGLMTLLILSFATTARSRLQMAFNIAGATQADLAADAALNEVILSLLSERQLKSAPAERPLHDGAPRFCALSDAVVAISIEEESGKIDLNAASEALLQAALVGFGVEAREAEKIAAAIVAFRSEAKGAPANDGAVATDKPFGLKRAPFGSVMELDQASGVSPSLFHLLSGFVTVHSRLAKVDARTAPPALFAALAGFSQDDVRALTQAPFPNGLDRKDPRFPQKFKGNGDGGAILAHVEAVLETGQTSVREAVIEFREASGAPFVIRELRRGRARNLEELRSMSQDSRTLALAGCA